MCAQKAGHGTDHPGLGPCRGHGGGRAHIEEAWKMAREVAGAQDITPHEALLGFVRAAAGRAGYLDMVVGEKLRRHVEGGGDPFDPPDELVRWLRQSRDERTAATRTAKAAVDAGVMAALERRLDVEGEVVAGALGAVLDALGLDQEQRIYALGVAQAALAGEELPEPVAPSAAAAVEAEPDLMEDFRRFAEQEGFDPDEDDEDDDDE
jgi:hypothetical protein